MTVMVALALSVLAACGLSAIMRLPRAPAIAVGVLFVLGMIVELWPTQQATYAANDVPPWVAVLRNLPERGAVVVAGPQSDGQLLYFQTIYNRPMAFGYISRVPTSVQSEDVRLLQVLRSGDWTRARSEFGFSYLAVTKAQRVPGLKLVYSDENFVIQELTTQAVIEGFHL
jgi:hypothetical protein